jgi:uncharacterized protein
LGNGTYRFVGTSNPSSGAVRQCLFKTRLRIYQNHRGGLGKLAKETYATGSFADIVRFNLWDGRVTNWAWTYYNGRYLQLLALFFGGMLLGRVNFFENLDKHLPSVKKMLVVSLLLTFVFVMANKMVVDAGLTKAQLKLAQLLTKSFADLIQTLFYIALFVLLFQRGTITNTVKQLSAVGRMNLSNYLLQAIISVSVFYGFGLGLYRYLGASWSLLFGILFFVLQVKMSKWWLMRYHYGPAEWLWRVLTKGSLRVGFRK